MIVTHEEILLMSNHFKEFELLMTLKFCKIQFDESAK